MLLVLAHLCHQIESDSGLACPDEEDSDIFRELVSPVKAVEHHELCGELEILSVSLLFESSSESSFEGACVNSGAQLSVIG